jgi:hypothetical protein
MELNPMLEGVWRIKDQWAPDGDAWRMASGHRPQQCAQESGHRPAAEANRITM